MDLVLFLARFGLCEAVGHEKWGLLNLPAFLAFLLLCELRSGVALDSWWKASHLKGTWQYRGLIAWHSLATALFLVIAYVIIAT
jgi:hypothetical protein